MIEKRNRIQSFDSNSTELLDVEQVKEKLLTLAYIRNEISAWRSRQE